MVEHESSYVTYAPRSGLGRAGSRAGAEDDRVGLQPLCGCDDLLLGAPLSDEVGNPGGRQSRGKSFVPHGQ